MEFKGVELKLYHTQELRQTRLSTPIWADGFHQWLGNGFYFWHDFDFANWWGQTTKCRKGQGGYSIYGAQIRIDSDSFLDTVFDEDAYNFWISNIESFAKVYYLQYGEKPTVQQFNEFISHFNLWGDFKVIRFQDITSNNELLSVKGYFYKKRIQYRITDISLISNFIHMKDFTC